MKKIFAVLFSILLVGCLCFSVSAEGNVPRLTDNADILTYDEEAKLTKLLDEISERQNFDVVVHTCYGDSGYDIVDYADCYYDDHFGINTDGAAYVIDMSSNKWSISTSGRGVDNISNDKCDEIGEEAAEYLKSGDYYEAMVVFAEGCDDNCNGPGYNWFFGIAISLGVGFVIAFIATGVMKGQLKSVRFKAEANDYLVPGSLNLTSSRDIFLYRNVTRRAKPKNTSSGGSHTSSSGGRHGGSSGSF